MKRFDIIMNGPCSFTNTYHDGGMFVHASEACDKIARLEVECAALKADAERYRWLRAKSWTDQSDGGFSGSHRPPSFQAWRDDEGKKTRIPRRDIDAAIDAAMQAGEKP